MARDRELDGRRIEISEECIGSAQCVAIAPELFELDEYGLATLTSNLVGSEALELASAAESVCPLGAISVSAAHP